MDLTKESWRLMTWVRSRLHQVRAGRASAPSEDVRLVFVQYGDYSEAYERLVRNNGDENYYAQRYTLEYVAELAHSKRVSSVTVVTFSRDEELRELAPGLHTAGVRLYPDGAPARHRELIERVASLNPTHLIVSAPIVPLIYWGLERGLPVLPLFADSFHGNDLRTRVRNARLAFVLNDPRVRFVANHNLAAALDLARIGVVESKILPYDWPAVFTPKQNEAKSAPARDRPFRLVYVGMVSEPKGVGDLLRAMAELVQGGMDVELTVIGRASDDSLQRLASQLGLDARVTFRGLLPHREVRKAMREHDAVVVPSRHEYPEGLPMTLYEGLCSRSPLIVSDHPMFALRIRHRQNALVFTAGSPSALASRVRELANDAPLYEQLSRNAEQAAEGYLCPLKWDQLIESWLDPSRTDAIREYLLAASSRAA